MPGASLSFSYVCLLSVLTSVGYAATAEQWRGRSIYQVVTDRFAKSDNASYSCDTFLRKYCGGNWKGITTHLDYVQQLGFDAVWISPVVANFEGNWTKDINMLNSHFGTADDLKALSEALHSRGMYLMVDVVVNHFAIVPSNSTPDVNVAALDFSVNSPFSSQSDFHPYCQIKNNNQTEVEQCWLGDPNLLLLDLNTEDPIIVQTMQDWIQNLTKTYDVDGLRIDTVKHIRKDFWPGFGKAAGVFTLGEVLTQDVGYASDYTRVVDGILDYPTYFAAITAFRSNQGNLSMLVDVVTNSQHAYQNGLSMTGSFIENHDQPRVQFGTKDPGLVSNAITWPFIQDGIPIMYYGQEQGFEGSSDPSNREALWSSGYVTEKALVAQVRALNAARKIAATTNDNFYITPMRFIQQPDLSTLVVSKPPLTTLLTNVGQNTTVNPMWTIPNTSNLFAPNELVVNVLTCKTMTADPDGNLDVRAEAGMPQVLLPVSALKSKKDDALCPAVAELNKSNEGLRSVIDIFTVCAGALVVWGIGHLA
ncbi:glycoside hydrolase family 13 protein [Flammula alnicola]|nr:glycoside hydrolase family 13 protein [Flammula alnicola]